MLESTKKLITEIEELKEDVCKEIASDGLDSLSEKDFIMIRKLLKIIRTAENLMIDQAELMESINRKLDQLLEK